PHTIASYIVQGETGLAMIETGPSSCLDRAQAELEKIGLSVSDIKHVLLTHIHFDHAGAAGWWAAQGAHVYVHQVGAKHMIDPSRLVASASRIYGDAMDTMWGPLLPIHPDRLTSLNDGDVIEVGDLKFECLDTPGHASHHMTYKLGDIAFTGDAGGTRLHGRGLIDIPAAPPEFQAEQWIKTAKLIQSHKFREIYPTHFGKIADVEDHLTELIAFIETVTELMREMIDAGKTQSEMIVAFKAWQTERAHKAGLSDKEVNQYFVATPPYMSVAGISRYWKKKREAA
ncbi:MAG: MBL fold metallo-hydrolase, partial [Chloroflexota bacterium]